MIYLLFTALMLGLQVVSLAQNDLTKELEPVHSNLFSHEITYVGELAGGLSGGVKTGAVYLGLANLKIGFTTENLGLWKGGEFFAHGTVTHGGSPSSELFGDFHIASNIEAGNHTYLQELWYKQNLADADITIGLQNLNSNFVTSKYAALFLNSSFGIPSLISNNIPVPIFPLTALGITAQIRLSKSFLVRTALYDGCPESFETNKYNTGWSLNSNDGYQLFSELEISTTVNELPGTYKFGGYYHNCLKERDLETSLLETVFYKNYGVYVVADQTVWQKDEDRKIGLFAQVALSPRSINHHNYYLGGGVNFQEVLFENDALGLAFAHAGFYNKELDNETTIELFYKKDITESFYLQPDVQYIINPAGTEEQLKNVLAVFIRFGINF